MALRAPDREHSTLAAAQRAATGGLRVALGWQLAGAALRIGFAAALAVAAGTLVAVGSMPVAALAAGLLTLALGASVALLGSRSQAQAEDGVAEHMRRGIRRRLETMPARQVGQRPSGALIAALQRLPEAVAALVVGHRAAASMMAAGPLLVVCALMAVSWQAALMLLIASPVMAVFFIVVGGTIQARAAAQEKAFGQLAAQFEDRIRTLPTILSGHALDREKRKLETRMAAYAKGTIGMLQVAFLNAGIIDFFASLSIAILAVFLGLGHLRLIDLPGFSGLQLWQSLFILMLAPEFFAPFRRYAEQYHAKAEGRAAAEALDALLGERPGNQGGEPAGLDRFAAEAGFSLPATGLVAIVGQSGSGKSTLLRRLAGIEPGDDGAPAAGGVAPAAGVDWIAQDIHVPPGSLAEALWWNRPKPCPTRLLLAAGRVGLLDDHLLPGGLDARIKAGGENLSGGQRLRIGTVRALLSDRAIFADEPTAKLDRLNAGRVRLALAECARRRLVVVATHDRKLAALAELVLDLDHRTATRQEMAS